MNQETFQTASINVYKIQSITTKVCTKNQMCNVNEAKGTTKSLKLCNKFQTRPSEKVWLKFADPLGLPLFEYSNIYQRINKNSIKSSVLCLD